MSRRGSTTALEGQRVFIPDPDVGWIRATVITALPDGDKFEVRIDQENAPDLASKQSGTVTVNIKSPDFIGMESLPLQNSNLAQQGAEDMCSLNYLHEPAILYNLRNRFSTYLPYTYTGEIVIATNPYKWLPIYGDDHRAKYSRMAKRSDLPPHVYSTSAVAFRGIKEYGKNQSILVSGESGAGKTETVKILLDHLASIAGGEDDTTIQKVVKTNPLLESFGNAKTVRNDNSSRFGKWMSLQFNQRGHLIGSDINTYLLEKTRVVQHSRGERAYHVMYQVLASPAAAKARYGLEGRSKADFAYTGVGGDTTDMIEGKSDAARYQMTVEAMELINIKDARIDALFRSIAGVLYLGQIQFGENPANHDGCIVTAKDALTSPAQLLGTTPQKLEQALTHRTMTARADKYDVPLNKEKAVDSRDGLAKEIYSRVFAWLCDRINDATAQPKGVVNTVGLLDIFGFESFAVNRFEQFCINYANEKLQQKFTQDVFKTVQVEYQEQGIPWSHIGFKDNAEVLSLIEGHRTGLIGMLDEECHLPKGGDEPFVSKAAKAHGAHPNFEKEKRSSSLEFTVKHYAGAVTYNALGFLDKNKDTLQDDLLEMLGGSSNPLLSEVFSPKDEERDRSPARSPTPAGKNHGRKGSLMQESVGAKFKRQLHSLMTAIQQTSVQYVRCIKPNKVKSADMLDNIMVVQQLRCAGVIEAIRISRAAYPNRLPFDEFVFRFQALAGLRATRGQDMGATCRQIIKRLLPNQEDQYAIGLNKVYFRSAILEELEERRGVFVRGRVLLIQKLLMGNVARQQFLRKRKAAVVVQARTRGYLGNINLRRKKNAAFTLQMAVRVYLAKCKLHRRMRAKKERERKAREEQKRKQEAERQRELAQAAAGAVHGKGSKHDKHERRDKNDQHDKNDRHEKLDRHESRRSPPGSAREPDVETVPEDDEDFQFTEKDHRGNGYDHDDDASHAGGRDQTTPEHPDDDDYHKYRKQFYEDDDQSAAHSRSHKGHQRRETREDNEHLRVEHQRQESHSGNPRSPRTARRNSFLEYHPKFLLASLTADMRTFLHTPAAREAGTLKCFIRREKAALSKLRLGGGGEVYSLFLEGKGEVSERFLLCARKRPNKMTSNYLLSMEEGDLEKASRNFVGKLRATTRSCDEFQVFDAGVAAKDLGKTGGELEERQELAAIHYSSDKLDDGGRFDGPRKMHVALAPRRSGAATSSLLDRMKRGSLQQDEALLVNRSPRWNAKVGAFVLNFHGRVTQASVKNFQLIQDGDQSEKIILQFGKTQPNEFTMDFCYPLSPLQAFAVTLTSFDCK